jgi:gliding motility-associated-like protein
MRIFLLLFFINLLGVNTVYSQCPQVYDGTGTVSSNPYWINCTGGAYTLNLSSPSSIGSYTVVWGDGTPNTTGSSLAANTIITHGYAIAIDTFIIKLITSAPSCTLSGVVVMEKPVNASIQIPVGGVTTACAPATLAFINASTDVSQTTSFSWNFGDGSPNVNYNYTNAGQTVTHTYNKGTVNCQTIVTLSAQNYCTFGTPTTAQFNPIQIYDKDQAAITPDAYLKCWPDNSFTFTNTTSRNCYAQGNNGIRYEKWDFGNYWGTGHDSIINWTAWPPTFPKTVAYPSIGNYSVILYDSNECGVDTTTLTVSIITKPTAGLMVHPDTVCVGTSLTFTNTSTTGVSYKWNYGDNATYTSTNYNPQTHTYASAGTYTVSVVAYVSGAANSCKDTARLVVTVLPSPTANFTDIPSAGCNTITTVFTDASVGAISWQWNFGNSNTFNGQTPPSQTYTTGTYTVSLLATSANNCKNTKTGVIHVYQKPVPQFTTNVGCANNTVIFTDQSTHAAGDNITSWNWEFGDGSTSSSTQNPTHTYTAATTYSVVLSVATAHCSDSITVPLVINPLPVVSFINAPDSGCPALVVTFTNTSTGAASYSWNFGNAVTSTNANPTETFSNTTTATQTFTTTLTGTSAVGCKDSTKNSIKVFGKPVAAFTSNSMASCAPFNVTFTNNSQNAVSYVWNFGDGTATSTSITPTHLYQNTTGFLQNYTVTLHVTNVGGCQDSTKQIVQAYPQAQFNFQSLPDSGCTPLHVNFPAAAGAVLYQWDFGDGSPAAVGASPSHTYTNSTTSIQIYTVQLVATNAFNCVDTAHQPIKVFPKPTSVFVLNKDSGCAPFAVTYTNAAINATSYHWFFGDGVSAATTNTSHTYTTSSLVLDSFQVKLVSYNSYGCTDTAKKEVYVFPKVNASFTSDTSGCSLLKILYNNSTQGASSYVWNYGDGSATATNPAHTYTNSTASVKTYTTQLIAKNSFGCTDTARQKITVLPKPTASFSLNPMSGCTPLTPIFINNSLNATSVAWNFGDGTNSTVSNPVHTYTNTSLTTQDSFNVQLVVTNGFNCKDTAKKYLYVFPKVLAGFYADTPICAPVNVSFHNTTQGTTQTTYTWNFGDGSPLDNTFAPTHTYNNTTGGTLLYTATLSAANSFGCTSSFSHTYDIYPKPTALFVMTPTVQTYPARTIHLINNTANASSFTNFWEFGDGNTSNVVSPPNHTYATWGTYTVTLVVSSQYCKDSLSKVEIVTPPLPIAGFKGKKEGCTPLRVPFISTSQYATSYSWDFGDTLGTASIPNPIYVYTKPNTYSIKLVVTGPGGKDSIIGIDSVTVYPLPTALFVASPTVVTSGVDPVSCNASTYSKLANSYIWNFGDNTPTVTAANPTHTYQQAGTFIITLEVISLHGCKDSTTFPIVASEETGIVVPNAFTPNPGGPSADGVYDPTSTFNDIFHPNVTGLKTYELDIFDRWGELLFVSKDVHVGWDGYYKGKLCQQSVYIWKIKGITTDGKNIEKAGDLTLLR